MVIIIMVSVALLLLEMELRKRENLFDVKMMKEKGYYNPINE